MSRLELHGSPLRMSDVIRTLESRVSPAAIPDFVEALEYIGGYIVTHGAVDRPKEPSQWWGIFSPRSLAIDELGVKESAAVFGITNFFGSVEFGLYEPSGTGQLVRSPNQKTFNDRTGRDVWFGQQFLDAAVRVQATQELLTAMVRTAEQTEVQENPFSLDWTIDSNRRLVVGQNGLCKVHIRNLLVVAKGTEALPIVGEDSIRPDGLFYYYSSQCEALKVPFGEIPGV